ncbi:MAG: hypothetical protein AB7O49_11800 [Sphingomonadales bacterium]
MNRKRTTREEAARIPLSEWLTAFLGALLVLSVICYTAYLAVTERGTPPDISLRVEQVRPASGGYLAEIAAINRGGSTAAEVTVEAVLRAGERAETRQLVFDFLPMHSRRSAGMVFRSDPRRHPLELRVLSHREP